MIGKSNHYLVRNGKLLQRESETQKNVNYKWLPCSEINKPSLEDYYRETVKKLQRQVQQLTKTISKQTEKGFCSRCCQVQRTLNSQKQSHRYELQKIKRQHEYQTKVLQDKFNSVKKAFQNERNQLSDDFQSQLNISAEENRRKQQILVHFQLKVNLQREQHQDNVRALEHLVKELNRKIYDKQNQLTRTRGQHQRPQSVRISNLTNSRNNSNFLSSIRLCQSKNLTSSIQMDDSKGSQYSYTPQKKTPDFIQKLRQKQREISFLQNQLQFEKYHSKRDMEELHKKIIEAQLHFSLQQNELVMLHNDLRDKHIQLQAVREEMRKKDTLIEHQLNIIDRLMMHIEENSKKEQRFFETHDQLTFGSEASPESAGQGKKLTKQAEFNVKKFFSLEEPQQIQQPEEDMADQNIIYTSEVEQFYSVTSNVERFKIPQQQVEHSKVSVTPISIFNLKKSARTESRDSHSRCLSTGGFMQSCFPSLNQSPRELQGEQTSQQVGNQPQYVCKLNGIVLIEQMQRQYQKDAVEIM